MKTRVLNKNFTSLILLLIVMLFCQCKVEISQDSDDYSLKIYRWFSQDYEKLQETDGTWFLYFDDQLTCSTCKLDILSQVGGESNLWLITRFDSDAKLTAFKKSYKLENRILNLKPDQKHQFEIPFLFQLEGKTMKDLVLLNDEVLGDNEWNQFFSNTQ